MKIFLKKSISFIAFVCIVAFLLQALIFFRIKEKCITGNDNLDQTSNSDADIVFIGSSRCSAHFDPNFFKNTYQLKSINIGVDGHSELSMAIVRLQHYLENNKNLKYVVLSFDPLMFGGSFTDNKNMFLKNDFARYSFWPMKKNLNIINYFKFNWYEKYVPLYSIFKYGLLDHCLHLRQNNYIKYGYNLHNEHWDTILNPIVKDMKKIYFNNDQIPLLKIRLNDLKTLCLKKNIKLICIQTPVYKILFSDSTFNKTKYISQGLFIPFIAMNDTNIQNNISYFYNANHMNKYGVEKMNELLKADPIFSAFLKPL